MRRKDREIIDKSQIEDIIKQSQVCRLGMSDNNIPYIVPMCFGYENDVVYLHGATEGMKIDILKKNPKVCLEFEIDTELIKSDQACNWDMKYKSVIAMGKLSFLETIEEKRKAFNIIMKQYSKDTFSFPDQALNKTAVMKVKISRMTGKKSGY